MLGTVCCHMDDDCVHSVDVAMNHRIISGYALGVMMMMDDERDGIGMGESEWMMDMEYCVDSSNHSITRHHCTLPHIGVKWQRNYLLV